MIDIQLSDQPLNITACIDSVRSPEAGGIDVFIGTVRNHTNDLAVIRLEYEAYEPMALREMNAIAQEAFEKWPILNIVMHHRTGTLQIGEVAVIIAVAAAHRAAAFDACRNVIDTLKERVPIWKRDITD
jgi:molybdopterin synthase catalytic subunit